MVVVKINRKCCKLNVTGINYEYSIDMNTSGWLQRKKEDAIARMRIM